MSAKLLADGVGNVSSAVLRALAARTWPDTEHPLIELCDNSRWGRRHMEAGLVDTAALGLPKAIAMRQHLIENGWPADRVTALDADVRDLPRGRYRGGLTLALTDSHDLKHLSILRSQQAGAPAIAGGLGLKEAIIETFAPGEAGYCCVHGSDPTWQRRQPCVPRSTVSATAVASRDDRKTVRFAGQLAANMAADFLATGSLPHAGGWYVRGTTAERFSYAMQPQCAGPHDRPCSFEGVPLVCVPLPARALTMAALLEHVGIGGYYADRELAWFWSCQVCGQLARRLHAVHPAPMCSGCGHRMRASLERASGLTAAEMADLSGNAAITLADLGLTDETLVRCAARDGEITWIQLEEPHDQPA